jgi:hypothetical protein
MKIPFNAFGNRERLGWSYEKILTTPIRRFSKKRKTPFMKFNGKKQSILIWSRETGIKYSTIYGRFMKRLKPREILAEIDARSALEGKS